MPVEYEGLPEATDWTVPHHCINRLQQASIKTVVDAAKAAHYVDIVLRINGEYKVIQADWIKYLATNPEAAK